MPKGTPLHVLSDIRTTTETAVCAVCGPVGVRRKRTDRNPQGYNWECKEKRRMEKIHERRKNALENAERLPSIELVDTKGDVWQAEKITQTDRVTFRRRRTHPPRALRPGRRG